MGTGSGLLIVLDFNGNEVQRFTPHSAAVNDICIDAAGEYVGSCSEDGTVAVQSLYDPSEASTHWYHSPVKAVALAPGFSTGRRIFACGGLGGQLVLNSRGWFGLKDEVLHAGEGPIHAIKWHGPLLAWANDVGVKVYDSYTQQRISFIERPHNSPRADAFRPQLVWASLSCLVIGWADTIKVGVVRTRPPAASPAVAIGVHIPLPAGVSGPSQPVRFIEIVSLLKIDGYICGLAPVRLPSVPRGEAAAGPAARDGASPPGKTPPGAQPQARGTDRERQRQGQQLRGLLLAVLVYSCESNDELGYASGATVDGHAERPELRLISTENEELSSDALSLHQYQRHRAAAYAIAQQPPPYEPARAQQDGGGGVPFGLGPRAPERGGTDAGRPGWRAPAGAAADAAAGGAGGSDSDSSAGGGPLAATSASPALREPLFYVLSPFDLIVVRARDVHDHLRWLLEKGDYAGAVALSRGRASLFRQAQHNQVAELYLRHLLGSGQPEKAALAASELLGSDSALWRRWLAEFERAGELRHLVGALPMRPPAVLEPSVYELLLLRLLHTVGACAAPAALLPARASEEPFEFERLVRVWPPALYRAADVLLPALLAELRSRTGLPPAAALNERDVAAGADGAAARAEETAAAAAAAVAAAAERANVDAAPHAAAAAGSEAVLAALTASLARLYATCGRLDAALRLWLELRSEHVLPFVLEHSMVGAVRSHVRTLVALDAAGAIELFASHQHTVSAREVMAQLGGEPAMQHRYLHALFLKDVHAGAPFADLQVRLYATYQPDQLLHFLRASSAYALQPALRTCKQFGLVRAQVHILSRMGDSKTALELILSRLGDVAHALRFVREQREPELSAELLSRSLTSAQLASDLLDSLAGHNDVLQPTELLRQLPDSMAIPGLLHKISRILADYRRQQQLAGSCAQIVEQEARELALELFSTRRRALRLT